jgi:hypothetical protein
MNKQEANLRKDVAKYLRKVADRINDLDLEQQHNLQLDGMALVTLDLTGAAAFVKSQGVMNETLESS